MICMLQCRYADVAQLVVHLIRNQKVASSSLAISSTLADAPVKLGLCRQLHSVLMLNTH